MDEEENEIELTDEECLKNIEQFIQRSYSKGYVVLTADFEELMQSIYRATSWYYELQKLK